MTKACVEKYGVEIINDMPGGQADVQMYNTVGELGVAHILMHLEYNVKGMHQVVDYKPSVKVCMMDYFRKRLEQLRACGVKDVIFDLGYGFSRSTDGHYRLLIHQRGVL